MATAAAHPPLYLRVAAALADSGSPPWVNALVAKAWLSEPGLPDGWYAEFLRIASGPPSARVGAAITY